MLLNIRKRKKIIDIPLVQIRPCRTQTRRVYNPDNLRELALSIKNNGVLQPLIVRKITSSEYELIAGERRLRACALCGMKKAPCIVLSCTDQQAGLFSLAENIQRTDLNYFEEAQGITYVMNSSNLTEREAAKKLGKKQASIIGKLDILELTDEEKEIMIRYNLTEKHAAALLKVKDKTERRFLLSEVIEKKMNVSQTREFIEEYLRKMAYEKRQYQKQKAAIKDLKIFDNTINKMVSGMSSSGIRVVTMRSENEDCIEYVVKIPKNKSRLSKMSA